MYKFCTHVHSENPKTHHIHESFTTLKWLWTFCPQPHRFVRVVTATTRFWWHWTKCPHSFYCITFLEVHLLWSNPCNQVVILTTWSCTTELRGRCEKINGQILSVDFLEYRGVHLPLLCTHHPRTHVHSEKPKTRYIRNPLWRWSGLGHFDPDQPVPIKFPFWELDFSYLLFPL